MSHQNLEPMSGEIGGLEIPGFLNGGFLDGRPSQPRNASAPASLPDDVWDVFRIDDDCAAGEPEPGDFWLEPEDLEDA